MQLKRRAVFGGSCWRPPVPYTLLLGCLSLLLALETAGLRTAGHGNSQITANLLTDADDVAQAEGVRRCLHLAPGDEMEVSAAKQRYSDRTFLIARPRGLPATTGQEALQNTLEALLDGCQKPAANGTASGHDKSPVWFADVGPGDGALAALASSLGCGVAAFDADAADARGLEMTRCLNQPRKPFQVFSAVTSNVSKLNVSSDAPAGRKRVAGFVALDDVFMHPSKEIESATRGIEKVKSGHIAMLKVVLQRTSSNSSVLQSLQGARGLLNSGRVGCLVTEMNFDLDTSKALLGFFKGMEHTGYHFAHVGSLDYPRLEITDNGSYPLFKTDVQQLHELFDSYLRIRHFDERSGRRAYSGSLSLDRRGKFFDYTNLIFACRKPFSSRLAVREKGNIRFRNGMWWLEGTAKASI
mmetsp:Transcript_139973/g.241838  ORF Transcript_139973/g.241838 Transcript_139973/m.241838 type:complete len:413 (-) Transcript_139973:61-1299(-)